MECVYPPRTRVATAPGPPTSRGVDSSVTGMSCPVIPRQSESTAYVSYFRPWSSLSSSVAPNVHLTVRMRLVMIMRMRPLVRTHSSGSCGPNNLQHSTQLTSLTTEAVTNFRQFYHPAPYYCLLQDPTLLREYTMSFTMFNQIPFWF